MKLTTNTTVCAEVMCCLMIIFTILSACLAAPLDTFYPTDETDGLGPQRLQLLKDLREVLDIEERSKAELDKRFTTEGESTGLMRVLPPQKRFRPFRTQTRGGGVALCLWKVCPAAPWLVSRR